MPEIRLLSTSERVTVRILKWSKTTGADQQESASIVEASLAAAQRPDADPIRLSAAQLQWQLARLRASASKEELDKAKPKFLATLHTVELEASGNPRWDARNLVVRTKQLRAKVQTLEFEDRSALRWLN